MSRDFVISSTPASQTATEEFTGELNAERYYRKIATEYTNEGALKYNLIMETPSEYMRNLNLDFAHVIAPFTLSIFYSINYQKICFKCLKYKYTEDFITYLNKCLWHIHIVFFVLYFKKCSFCIYDTVRYLSFNNMLMSSWNLLMWYWTEWC